MLSISSIKSAGGAANYYGKDDYYVTGEADSPGLTWGGKGSETAGLSGLSSPEQFRSVLNGSHPAFNDGEVGKVNDRHRPGWDLTFSAPKTVSVMALVGGDRRLLEAHREAVKDAMGYVEKDFSITRVRQGDGTVKEVRTGNLVFATTEHQTSRAGDPQVHSHNVVANRTYDSDTKTWRALETSHLYKNFKTPGLVYQASLASRVMALGYDVVKDREGTFEIAGVNRAKVEAFSQRHLDIEAKIKTAEREKGRPLTPSEREVMVLKDRPKKLDHPRQELEARWQETAKQVGLDLGSIVGNAQGKSQGHDLTPQTSGIASDEVSVRVAQQRASAGYSPSGDDQYSNPNSQAPQRKGAARAFSYAVRVFEQSKTVFSKHEVLAEAIRIAPAGITAGQILASRHALQGDGRLQKADKTVLDGLTTKNALALERQVISRIEATKGHVTPSFTEATAPVQIARAENDPSVGIKLDDSQRSAAIAVLTSADRYVGVQGSAGVGKTTMFKVLKVAAKNDEFIGLAAQHDAAQVLFKEAGIESRTIESFLLNVERTVARGGVGLEKMRASYSSKTLLVDESSMQSNSQMDRLQRAVEVTNIKRAIFVGDERQLGSPEAGAPFRHALANGLQHTVMDNIRRQKDPVLLEAVKHLSKGNVSPAVRGIQRHISAIGLNVGDRDYAKAIHAAWSAGRAEGKDPRIIVPTNALRGAVAAEVRKTLIEEGVLGDGQQHDALRSARMSGAAKHRAENYREGHILVFHRAHTASGVKRDAHVTVVGRDLRNNVLLLQDKAGKGFNVDLGAMEASRNSYFEPYLKKDLEVRQGDQMVWDRHSQSKDKKTGAVEREFKVGQRFTVEGVRDDKWTIRDEDGKQHVLRADDPALKFVSYGYAETADRSQGKTYRDVIAALGSNHGEAATASRLYVQLSRTAEGFRLITDDVQRLTMRLNKQDGLNLIASRELSSVVQAIAQDQAGQQPALAKDATLSPAPGQQSPKTPETPDLSKDGAPKQQPERSLELAPQKTPELARTKEPEKGNDYSL
ncbi:MobF family relaxase [Brevundimonas nasdae]|uniref:Relaxase domain-containing protein n=1 Tax=Brevundimonas nasdae TaxID=172043 RepID=A0ABX8TQ28_9CAUL|nr:MobF family relaxase [Brevundimonas nasdae]QYC12407.1 relaxase domain-containing protein [Brevundimonas nasdae]